MSQQDNTKILFVEQLHSHVNSLCDLLGCEPRAAAPADILGRCRIATRMMAGTFSLMNCPAWNELLVAYENLLGIFADRNLPWDDRIAQVTSELIEREEGLAEILRADGAREIRDAMPAGDLAGLRDEIAFLLEVLATAQTDADSPRTESAGGAAAPSPQTKNADSTGPGTQQQTPATPMSGVTSEIRNISAALIEGLKSKEFVSRDWYSDGIAGIRDHLCFLNFYISSIQQMIENNNPAVEIQTCGLVPLRTVLTDFADEVSQSGKRTLKVAITGEDTKIDPRLLPVAGAILQRMATDAFNRAETQTLSIGVNVYERAGALRWQLSDNGNNFITDSRLDHEDQLAFYPGLRTVRKLLARYHGVLWVEPRDGHKVRFEFSLPASRSENAMLTWGDGKSAFGMRASQLCDLIPAGSAPRGKDLFGEFLTIDNKRVPLLNLDVLYAQAPPGGDNIAVVGSLERRIAIYVPGSGEMVEGKELEGVVPLWQGPAHLVAQVEDRRIAMLDADQIIEEYLYRTGDMNNEEESGGVVEEESRDSNSQVDFDSEINTPPEKLPERGTEDEVHELSGGHEIQVLVVEQSETLRDIFAGILEKSRIRAAFAADVDQAAELIHARSPQLIISEFRMPTMAAKILVETMGGGVRSIPVLVTTSQSGKTADLLVEKLGVAGYLSKPLNRDEIVSKVNGYLVEPARA
jgi:CheY-like chemotaxis protein